MENVFDIFDMYATDPNKELEGVWVVIGPAKRDASGNAIPDSAPALKIARSGNKRHGRIVSQLYEANEDVLKAKDDNAEARGEEITIEAMSKAILLGWRNLSFKKEALPDAGTEASTLTPEERLVIAKKLLSVKDFRDTVAKYAMERERFAIAKDKADAGN